MRKTLPLLFVFAISAGCAPRQDPGIPIPKSASSGVAAMSVADAAVARQADTLSAIDAAKRVIAENLSNADTIAYKALCCRVQDGRPDVYLNLEQGRLETTNRALDLAINGPGFFRIKLTETSPESFAYTRNGNFFRSKDGGLVLGHGDGYHLEPPVFVPDDAADLNISQDGVVTIIRVGKTEKENRGQILLYQLTDAEHLERKGAFYVPSDRNGEPVEGRPNQAGFGLLQQSFLEGSNVDLNREKLRADFLDRWRAQLVK